MNDPLQNLFRRMGGPPVVPRDSDIQQIVRNDPRFRPSFDPDLPLLDTTKNSLPIAEGVYKDTTLVSQKPITRDQAKRARQLAGRADVAWLHLGCVYELLRISTDVISQFQIENKQPHLHVESYSFDRTWIEGLQSWGTMIQGVDVVQAENLVRWLLNQLFVRRSQKTWWRLRRERILVSDPSQPLSSNPADQISVSVFLPLGNRGITCLDTSGTCPRIWFNSQVRPPDRLTPDISEFS